MSQSTWQLELLADAKTAGVLVASSSPWISTVLNVNLDYFSAPSNIHRSRHKGLPARVCPTQVSIVPRTPQDLASERRYYYYNRANARAVPAFEPFAMPCWPSLPGLAGCICSENCECISSSLWSALDRFLSRCCRVASERFSGFTLFHLHRLHLIDKLCLSECAWGIEDDSWLFDGFLVVGFARSWLDR